MRKKKQEMLETQIECQKVSHLTLKLFLSVLLPLFLQCTVNVLSDTICLALPGVDKSAGEKPRHET